MQLPKTSLRENRSLDRFRAIKRAIKAAEKPLQPNLVVRKIILVIFDENKPSKLVNLF
jgi:hypothetical protein